MCSSSVPQAASTKKDPLRVLLSRDRFDKAKHGIPGRGSYLLPTHSQGAGSQAGGLPPYQAGLNVVG